MLAARESITGLVSVVDEHRDAGGRGIRVLRCDHSIIGGSYVDTRAGEGLFLNESARLAADAQSIFGSFYFPTFAQYMDPPVGKDGRPRILQL